MVSHHAANLDNPHTILGERKVRVYCDNPDLFYLVIDLGLREGYEIVQDLPGYPMLYFVYE